MELLHTRFVDADGKTLAVEELPPAKDVAPEVKITNGQRTAVTLGVEDAKSLHVFLGKFLEKHNGKDGDS